MLAAGAADWVYERQSEEMLAPLVPQPLDHLIDCLEHGRTPIATLHDARASLAMALACLPVRPRRPGSSAGWTEARPQRPTGLSPWVGAGRTMPCPSTR